MSETFNYISFGNREYVEGPVDRIEMNIGRLFEYTPTDIAKGLESLDATSIAFLEKLPTFLCSEIGGSYGAFSMIVKYGRIEDVTPGLKEVSARFKTLIDFGSLEFDTLDDARGGLWGRRFPTLPHTLGGSNGRRPRYPQAPEGS